MRDENKAVTPCFAGAEAVFQRVRFVILDARTPLMASANEVVIGVNERTVGAIASSPPGLFFL